MVEIIVGSRGTGKTKQLIDRATTRAAESDGNVICIEKGPGLQFNLGTQIRLIDIEEYHIQGADAYFGFISGLLAGNYDITNIFCDATFKIICGEEDKDMAALGTFLTAVEELGKKHNCTILFTISADKEELPVALHSYIV